jgi:glycosyltransferase involved in cell wall biosynthesis
VAVAPRLTVVIPAWDVGAELTAAVASVVAEGPAVGVLVVDNASAGALPPTEGAERLRLPTRAPLGRVRNAGLDAVTTPYVMFLDADDRLLPGAAGRLLAALEAAPDAVMTVAPATSVDAATGAVLRQRSFPPRIAFRLAGRPRLLGVANLVRNLVPVTGSVVIRTEAARAAGGFAELRLGQDWVLGAALGLRGRVVYLREPGSLYSVRRDSITSSGSWADFVAVRRAVRERVRRDPAAPAWVRLALPAVAVGQTAFALRRWRYRREPKPA